MKKLLLLPFLFFSLWSSAQNHVDLFKINYGETFKNNFKSTQFHTKVKTFEAEFTLPIPLDSVHALISGIDHQNNHLQVFPEAHSSSFYNTTLKLGLASAWNEKWSSSIVFLPKLASDYQQFSGKDFYLGIYATFAIKKQDNFKYRFGFYSSTEAYGVFATPILGWYYKSPNNQLEMNISLPIDGEITYNLNLFSLGIDYVGISRSFRMHSSENPKLYADLSSLEFSTFLQTQALHQNILLRAKLGYSTNKYKIYEEGEKIDLALSAFNFGDHRTVLNPAIQGGVFFKIEAIYRLQL